MGYVNIRSVLLVATMLASSSVSVLAQDGGQDMSAETGASSGNDIIVTAQRVEQRLQDVPISITVLDQAELTNNNIVNAKDLATYTPGLSTNNRYGADNTTFTIRGFTQEQRTYSTVGVFFADVVAPRGSGATFGGEGAGPGNLFDLQNVQVLKGPQGTLFGRNVTGGAVLLVPRKPTDKLEGYVEASIGNYDLRRGQAVLNLPLADTFKVRLGVDRMKRDGYLRNVGKFGDGRFGNHGMGDVDFWAARASIVADLTPDLENYLIATYSHSQSNGVIPKVTQCFPGVTLALGAGNAIPLGNASCAQLNNEAQSGFWTVSNRNPDNASVTEQWQIINTTTWRASDSLTVKAILSYAEFRGITNLDLYGNYMVVGAPFGQETSPNQVTGFAFTSTEPASGHTNAQSSAVAELQFQGRPGDGRFTWQAGGYLELNDPLGFSGVQTFSFTPCTNPATLNCLPATPNQSVGTGSFSVSKAKFRDYAIYAQASLDLTEQLKLTVGGRYTWDKASTRLLNETVLLGNPATPATASTRCTNPSAPGYSGLTTFPYTYADRFNVCAQDLSRSTKAPTWLINLDYKPISDVLLYAKWSRGYRQGGLAFFGPDPIQPFDKETVDTYELGGKASWRGAMPGYFNIAGFYNDFRNQQVLFGVQCVSSAPGFTIPCSGNAAILNAGKSTLHGFEVEAGISPFQGLKLEAAYGYFKSKLERLVSPAAGTLPPYNVFTPPLPAVCAGLDCTAIPNSGPPHKLVLSANYTLPVPDSVGNVSFGGTFVYTSRYRIAPDATPGSNIGINPGYKLLNLNVTWENVASLPIDASLFVTNVTNEKYFVHVNDNQLRGFVSRLVGEPRMWGARLRYKFGS